MGYKLINIQNLFNNAFDFENLKLEATKDINKILIDEKSHIYINYNKSEIIKIKNARIEYSSTKIIVNTSKEKTMFALNFELYTPNEHLPDYVYSKIYNYEE